MLCGWKFPFKSLRYLGKFPAEAAVATESWQQCLSPCLVTSLSYPWILLPKSLSLLLLPWLSVFTIFCSLCSLIFHLMKTIPVFTPGCSSRAVLGGCDCFSDLLGVSVLVYGLNIRVYFSIFSFLCLFHSWSSAPSSSSPRTSLSPKGGA